MSIGSILYFTPQIVLKIPSTEKNFLRPVPAKRSIAFPHYHLIRSTALQCLDFKPQNGEKQEPASQRWLLLERWV